MKKLKGISVYCGLDDYPLDSNLEYLELAKSKGVDFVFSSAHIDEAKSFNEFETIVNKCYDLGLQLVVDASKKAFDKVEKFLDKCVLRLDYGFSKEEVVEFTNKYPLIELNASLVTKDYLDSLKELGANLEHIRVSYNFYPKRYTGLDIHFVKENNKLFKSYGLTVIAYIPSNSNKRPPLYDGLPSVERHRNLDIELVCYELFAALCDGVCIGDAYASHNDLEKLVNVSSEYYEIPIKIIEGISKEELEILNRIHRMRLDSGPYMKRSSSSRGIDIVPFNTISIIPYMVTIDNSNYLRYRGELGIALKDMENVGKVNVVASVLYEAHTLVDLIDAPAQFRFKITNEV